LDLLVTCLSLAAAIIVYHYAFHPTLPLLYLFYRYTPGLYLVLPVWFLLFRINGMHDSRRLDTIPKVAWIVIWSVGEGIALLILISYFLRITDISRMFVLLFGFINIVFLVLERMLLKEFLHRLRARGYNFRRILIVGTGNRARAVAKKLSAHREWGMMVFGFLSQARSLEEQIADGRVGEAEIADTRHLVFNNRLDAAVTGFFALLILALLVEAGVEWYRILTRRKAVLLTESPYVRTKWAEGSP